MLTMINRTVRNNSLLGDRLVELLRHADYPRLCQCGLHFRRPLRGPEVLSTQGAHGGCCVDDHVLPRVRFRRSLRPGSEQPDEHTGCRQCADCILVPVHCGLRHDLGPFGMGGGRRAVPCSVQGTVYGPRNGFELAVELPVSHIKSPAKLTTTVR